MFRDLAIIIFSAKIFGLIARKLKAPQVVGEIIAGLLLGLITINGEKFINAETGVLPYLAEIGVVLIMFSAGLGTNLRDLIKAGPKALLIATAGVFVPFFAGITYYFIAYGNSYFDFNGLIIGAILTATSVSITVQALRELGYLKGKVGTTILSAAVIDDIIGMIVLTVVMSVKPNEAGNTGALEVLKTIGLILLFFVFAIVVGFVSYKIFKLIDKKYEHTRKIPIFGVALCFFLAFMSSAVFGVADIIGAYCAGIILCNIKDSSYVANKIDINSYMIFGPIFFASIGLKTDFRLIDGKIILFAIGFVLIGLVTKIIGCGLAAKATKYTWSESAKIGIGMMTRGEVALIVANKGVSMGLPNSFFAAVILLIVVSSILTPILLKILYTKYPEHNNEFEIAQRENLDD